MLFKSNAHTPLVATLLLVGGLGTNASYALANNSNAIVTPVARQGSTLLLAQQQQATVTTTQKVYATNDPIQVRFSGLPGDKSD